MEVEKRKRQDDGETNGKRGKAGEEDDGVNRGVTAPEDEEVEEFFAILKRIKVAVNYFQNRNDRRELTATPWNPSFEREDFEGVVKKDPEGSEENHNAGLDLNSDPASDVSYTSF
ncbi:hypothetical protein BUALT_Bualt05G0129400 [Buddleja alternifolia]|uniref:NIM1-interacting protein n=1 Tax=Buddleja alternifolia TaxID=168488 RepID=A0AAV6XKA0_9LAMI|nr:hypothetical protein BUALT_Bualt05G0129400 [Buddleja alternifolia]